MVFLNHHVPRGHSAVANFLKFILFDASILVPTFADSIPLYSSYGSVCLVEASVSRSPGAKTLPGTEAKGSNDFRGGLRSSRHLLKDCGTQLPLPGAEGQSEFKRLRFGSNNRNSDNWKRLPTVVYILYIYI